MFLKNDKGQTAYITNVKIQQDLISQGFVEITEQEFNELNPIVEFKPDAKAERIQVIKARLNELDKDFMRQAIGYSVPNISGLKSEFRQLYSEICELEGKTPNRLKDESFTI